MDRQFHPDDFTWGAVPEVEPAPAPQPLPLDAAQKAGFANDAALRRWCVEAVAKSRACYDLAKEARGLNDFILGFPAAPLISPPASE